MEYDYNPSTGTYVRSNARGPPIPPKEFEFIKETQGAAELDGSDCGSLDSERYQQLHYQQPAPARRRKVRILSLDGGGIRGYSTLVILGELMHQVYVQENGGRPPKSSNDLPRPCDYFDLIGGNGTSPHSFPHPCAPGRHG
jgi:hypothetical protein